ncbi:MAG: hypothetical protein FWD31_11870 [Planctomycetaceae bacterium]|nr:hypothetical protein [Planctomycetaceae bacterium]
MKEKSFGNPPTIQLELDFESAHALPTPPTAPAWTLGVQGCFDFGEEQASAFPSVLLPEPTSAADTTDALATNSAVDPCGASGFECENENHVNATGFIKGFSVVVRRCGITRNNVGRKWRSVVFQSPIRFYEARPPPFVDFTA